MNSISPTRTHSSPFSISDILSKDTGLKKSPTATQPIPFSTPSSNGISRTPIRSMFSQENANKAKCASVETPKRPKKFASSHFPSRNPKISLSEVGSMIAPSSSVGYTGMVCEDIELFNLAPQNLTTHFILCFVAPEIDQDTDLSLGQV